MHSSRFLTARSARRRTVTVGLAVLVAVTIPTLAGGGHQPSGVASYTGCLSTPAHGGVVYNLKPGDGPATCKSGHTQIHLSGGDITAVVTGTGLEGGATNGSATISLADGGVTSTKLADSAVTQPKIANGAVGTSEIGTIPAARATSTSAQSIPNGVEATIALNSEVFDTASLHDNSTDNSRLTAPVAGVYEMKGRVAWLGSAGGFRAIAITQSGVGTIAESREASTLAGDNVQNVSTLARLNAGDFIELHVFQSSGATSDSAVSGAGGSSAPELSMHWVGP